MPRIAFFDVDNTLTRGSTLYFLGKGMYNRGFFTKRDIGAWVLANLRFRMTGTEKKEVIERFQKAATDFIGGHKVDEIRAIGEDIYKEFVSPSLWSGTMALAKRHQSQGDEVWLVTASPKDFADLIAEKLGFTGALGTIAEITDENLRRNAFIENIHGELLCHIHRSKVKTRVCIYMMGDELLNIITIEYDPDKKKYKCSFQSNRSD